MSLWLAVMPQCEACGRPMADGRDLPPATAPNPIKRGQQWCWRLTGVRCWAWPIYVEWKARAEWWRASRKKNRKKGIRFLGPGFPPRNWLILAGKQL